MHTLFAITTAEEKNHIKCRVMWHFIRVYTDYEDKNDLQIKKTAILFRN